MVDLNTQGFLSSDSSSESEEDEQSSNPSKNASKEDEEAVTSRSSFYKIKSVLVRTKNSMGRRADEEIEDDMVKF